MVEIGRRIVHKDGETAIYLGSGTEKMVKLNDDGTSSWQEVSKVYSLASGRLMFWSNANWTEDATPGQAQAVVLLNAEPVRLKISTVFWGVILAQLVLGIVGGLLFAILH